MEKLAEGGLEDDGHTAASIAVLDSLAPPARVAARVLGAVTKDTLIGMVKDAE